MVKKRHLLLITWWAIGLFSLVVGQNRISGKVVNAKTSKPVAFATITKKDFGTITNSTGLFNFDSPDSGLITICISALGFITDSFCLNNNSINLEIRLTPSSLKLSEVTVSAIEKPSILTANTHISSDAINHIQANSLADVLSLVPGVEQKTRDLTESHQGYLRTPVSTSEKTITSRGVGLYIDGIPISNNANLQVTNTIENGTGGHFESTSGLGNDLRKISTDNIASIDIIRGIAPSKYGDITNGVIDIKREMGLKPLTISAQYDPKSTATYIGKGIAISQYHLLNADLDFRKSISDIRLPVPAYNQLSSRLTHHYNSRNRWWRNTISADLGYSYDIDKKDKNDAFLEKRSSEETSLRIKNSGQINLSTTYKHKVTYALSWQYKQQKSQQTLLNKTKNIFAATAYSDSTYESTFLPSSYYSDMSVNGKPRTFNSNIGYNAILKSSKFYHNFNFGSDYRHEKNNGKGRAYITTDGYYAKDNHRNRSYNDIPAISQLSFYAEDAITYKMGNNKLIFNFGFRYDIFTPQSLLKGRYGQLLQPRINIGYTLANKYSFYAGYGISGKQAPLIFLYPDNAYLDVANFGYTSSIYPEENRVIATTRVINTRNSDVTFSKMKKIETGAQLNLSILHLNYSLFLEDQSNIPSFAAVITPLIYDTYDTQFYIPGMGAKPEVDYLNVDQSVSRQDYLQPTNNKSLKRKGCDFSLATATIDQLPGTKFTLTGALFNTQITDNNLDYDLNSKSLEGNTDNLIGIYKSRGLETNYFLTKLTYIQHIPQLGFISSITLQNRWINQLKYINIATSPEGFIDNNGKLQWFAPSAPIPDKYSFLKREYTGNSTHNLNFPISTNVSLRLTKEIANNITFSLYINNLFFDNPAWINNRDLRIVKGNEELYFSGEIKIKL